ncbi:origin recognition complex subunit 4 C-terminus-domain-containing protein [Fomes fomentarius]|nr:origin recognition complex subunit 4 C-terminus-domain-containing protein [Fomes fomentarius]
MPPKRKATATGVDSEPTQTATRRRTRSTAATAIEVLVELPPAKRTRRHTTTKTDDEHAPPEKQAEGLEEPKRVLRGTRAAARGRKVESVATEKLNQPDPAISKRRGRGKKVEPEEDVEEPHLEVSAAPRPLSPIQEKPAPIVPKKRGRQATKTKTTTITELETELEPDASEVVETSRPRRTRRTKAINDALPSLSSSAAKPQLEEEVEESQAEPAASPPPSPTGEKPEQSVPKKRGRAAKAKLATKPETEVSEIAESSRPKRTRRTKDAIDAFQDEKTVRTASSSKLIDESKAPAPPNAPKTRSRRKVGPVEPPKPSLPKPALRTSKPPSPSNSDESSSEDELLLTSKNRPATPTRNGGRIGTPRTVLHSVEITTPRHLRNTLRRDYGSPTPRASTRIPPVGTPRLPAVFPTVSGSPIKRLPTKQRITRTPSPRPNLADASEPESPTRTPRRGAATFLANGRRIQPAKSSDDLPHILPDHLRPLLDHQKRAILKSLQHPPEIDEIELYGEDYPPTNSAAYEQLTDLLTGSVVRGEGNSCLLIGPSGSGKTQMVERAIATMPSNPIVVRLSGYAQHNDRLAIREIAWQLAQQTGTSFLPSDADEDEDGEPANPTEAAEAATKEHEKERDEDMEGEADEDENPFVDHPSAPAPTHLLALISMIPTLPRPTIIVLDGFDLFAGHARQALLYCLLDTAQSCRAGTMSGTGSGMAVVGVTARVDTINLLEKRVKSRFSGRMIRTACPAKLGHWVELAKGVLGAPVGDAMEDEDVVRTESGREWEKMWKVAVEKFAEDEEVAEMLRETYALARDFQMFRRIMTGLALELTPASPFPTRARLESTISRQRCPPRYPSLNTLPYPAVCLLIASVHAQTSGHDVFTFEMLYDSFKTQLRASQSAPVHVEGGGIGMVRCSREVLFSAFERLVDLRIFLAAAAPSANIAKEFALHRSIVDRFTVRKAVDAIGQLNLKKWLTKA